MGGDRIGRVSTDGVISEFAVGTRFSEPVGITAGPDGNLWFTESLGNKIGRITPAGNIMEFPLPRGCPSFTGSCLPSGIVAGPDGNLWFTENEGRRIGRITVTGFITEF